MIVTQLNMKSNPDDSVIQSKKIVLHGSIGKGT